MPERGLLTAGAAEFGRVAGRRAEFGRTVDGGRADIGRVDAFTCSGGPSEPS